MDIASTDSADHPTKTKRWPWIVLLALFVLSTGFIAYAIAPASVLPLIITEYGIDKASASASISAIFLTWAALQIPAGFIMDRYDNRRLLAIGGGVFIFAALTGLVVPNYPTFLLTRLLGGASVVFIFVGSINILSQVLPDARKALGMSIFVASPPVGVALAQASGPLIAQSYGWRAAILAYSIIGAAGLIGFLTLHPHPITAGDRLTIPEFITTLQNRSVLLVALTSLCTYAIWTFLITWMPSYGTEVLGFSLAAAGAAAALVPLAGILGRPGGGWLSELLNGRLRPVIIASFLTTIPLLYFLNSAPTPVLFLILLALTGAAVNLTVGLYLAYIDSLAALASRGTSLSVLLTFSQVGNLLAPVVSGWMITEFSWAGGFGFAIGLAIVGLGTIMLVPTAHTATPG